MRSTPRITTSPMVVHANPRTKIAESNQTDNATLLWYPGTPSDPEMSPSRTPSPVPGGGWSSPGLNSGRSSPSRGVAGSTGGHSPIIWEGSRVNQNGGSGKGGPSSGFRATNAGTNQRGIMGHVRRLSSGLPMWNNGKTVKSAYSNKDKGAGQKWYNPNRLPLVARARRGYARMNRTAKTVLWALVLLGLCLYVFYHSRKSPGLLFWCLLCKRDAGFTTSFLTAILSSNSTRVSLEEIFNARRW